MTKCGVASLCEDDIELIRQRRENDSIDPDLADQYDEVCTHPAGDEVRERSCMRFRQIKYGKMVPATIDACGKLPVTIEFYKRIGAFAPGAC